MSVEVFVDTNILVYAHDSQAGDKHRVAAAKITDLWHLSRAPIVSVQVLQELFVNLVRRDIGVNTAREIIADYARWRVVENTAPLLVSATHVMERHRLSFWDALIVAAARQAGAQVLWSEDFNPGQKYEGVTAVNPLD